MAKKSKTETEKTSKNEEQITEADETLQPGVAVKAGKDNLIPVDKYLSAGVHIGTQRKLADMKKFVYKIRPDGLSILDIGTIDSRIRVIANFISQYNPEKVVFVCARDVGKKPINKLAEAIGAKAITTRFMPGSLTNPSYERYSEPELLFVVDPSGDKQVLSEALHMNIPVISMCDTNNMTQNIDLILPMNNKGKKSIALVLWALTREILKKQGKIKTDDEFTLKVEDFEEEKLP